MKTDMATTLSAALSGLQVGVSNAQKAAGEVAKLTTDSKSVQDAVRPLLNMSQAEQQVATTSKIIEVENDTLGRFVDERA